MGEQQMTPGEIATRLMDAGIDIVGSSEAIADEFIQQFLDQLEAADLDVMSMYDIREFAANQRRALDFSRLMAAGPLEAWSALLQPSPSQSQAQLRDWLESAWTAGHSYAANRPRGGVTGASAPEMAAAYAMEDVVSEILRRVAAKPLQQGVTVPVNVRQSDNGTWWAEVATSRRSMFCEWGDTSEEAVAKVQTAFNAWAAALTPTKAAPQVLGTTPRLAPPDCSLPGFVITPTKTFRVVDADAVPLLQQARDYARGVVDGTAEWEDKAMLWQTLVAAMALMGIPQDDTDCGERDTPPTE